MSSSSSEIRRAMALALALLGLTSGAAAQDDEEPRPKVVELEDIVIESEVQKPNAFYILTRSSLGYEIDDLRTSFIDEIVRSAQRDPF